MSSLDIIENYIGVELTESSAKHFLGTLRSHVSRVIEEAAPSFMNWMENVEEDTFPPSRDRCLYIEALPTGKDWRGSLDHVRQLLLYAPNVAIPDPLAAMCRVPIKTALSDAEISWDEPASVLITDKVVTEFVDGLILLSKLRKAIKRGHVVLFPAPFCISNENIQRAVNQELESVDREGEDSYYEPILRFAAPCGSDPDGAGAVVRRIKAYGQICARLQLTPTAGDVLVRKILHQDYRRCGGILKPADIAHSLCEALLQYEVPIVNATFSDVLRIRENETIFCEWRKDFGDVIGQAYRSGTDDEQQFRTETRQRADELLLPKLEQLEAAAKGSVLQGMFVPGSALFGVAAATFYGPGLSGFPSVPLAPSGPGPLSWLVQKVIRAYNKSGREITTLRELYTYMLQK